METEAQTENPKRPLWQRLLVLVIGIPALVFSVKLLTGLGGAPVMPPLPVPNGFDDFLEATNHVVYPEPSWASGVSHWTVGQQKTWVDQNRETLDLLHEGMSKEVAVSGLLMPAHARLFSDLLLLDGANEGSGMDGILNGIRFGRLIQKGGGWHMWNSGLIIQSERLELLTKNLASYSGEELRGALETLVPLIPGKNEMLSVFQAERAGVERLDGQAVLPVPGVAKGRPLKAMVAKQTQDMTVQYEAVIFLLTERSKSLGGGR